MKHVPGRKRFSIREWGNTGAVMRTLVLSVILWSGFSPAIAMAVSVTLQWDPSPGPDVHHYELFWGRVSRTYNSSTGNIGLATQYQVSLPEGQTFYFAVKAFNSKGISSDYSDEVPFKPTVVNTPAATNPVPAQPPASNNPPAATNPVPAQPPASNNSLTAGSDTNTFSNSSPSTGSTTDSAPSYQAPVTETVFKPTLEAQTVGEQPLVVEITEFAGKRARLNLFPSLKIREPLNGPLSYYAMLKHEETYFMATTDLFDEIVFVRFYPGSVLKSYKLAESSLPADSVYQCEAFSKKCVGLFDPAILDREDVVFIFGVAPDGNLDAAQGAAFKFAGK